MKNGTSVKTEPADPQDLEDDTPHFWPAALGLRPVGAVSPPRNSRPMQALNARGMPARIRKKNKLFFDDNIVNAPPPRASPKRGPKSTPSKTPSKLTNVSPMKRMRTPKTPQDTPSKNSYASSSAKRVHNGSPDRKICQTIGKPLRNLLKLPKAYRWVCCEHFYSNIDRALLLGENDFQLYLKDTLPKLTQRCLTQVQWTKIRRIMGRPRRCSQAFFNEERKALEIRRQKIRAIQQRKQSNVSCNSLPNEIPMQLVIGSKVTARLRKPQNGLFTGTIEGVDTSNNTYRISFDRLGLDMHSVPDFEVLSHDPPDTINLTNLTNKTRSRNHFQGFGHQRNYADHSFNDPLLGTGPAPMKLSELASMGSYPIKLLEAIVKITNILENKKHKISKLIEFNNLAEKRKTYGMKIPDDFEKRYASIVIDLERVNVDLQDYLNEVQKYCFDMAPGLSVAAMLAPTQLRQKCRTEAANIVHKLNVRSVKNEKVLGLITDLIGLLLQAKNMADSGPVSYETYILEETMQQIKSKLDPAEQKIFQDVEVHMKQLQNDEPSFKPICNIENDERTMEE